MRYLAYAFACIAFSGSAFAQEPAKPAHQQTSPPPNSRFEIMQSPLTTKWTFRLDRYAGRVWQLAKTKDGGNTWEEMTVVDRTRLPTARKPRFRLFTSGLGARHTFLIDADTGKTWVVVSEARKNRDGSEYEVNLWEPFDSQ
jgi:hypothetical protein